MARRGRKLTVAWAEADDAAGLYERYRRERRPDVRPRLHALWLVRTEHTTREAAGVLGVDERTVQRWLGWYRAGGLAPLEGRHAGSQGAPSFLTAEQKVELAEEVATGRFRTAAEIRAWVQECWGGELHRGWDVRAAPSAALCPKSAASHPSESRPPRAGAVEKGGLGNALDAVGLSRTSRIGFGDEMRLGLRGTTRRVWGRRGTKVRQRLQLKYEWRYLFAAVDGQTGRVWWNWVPSMKAEALWPTIAGIQEADLLDALVWDNAPSHRDDDITDLDLAFVGLPPYSPELNPAERLFEEIRRRFEGRVYATLDDKVADVQAFLEALDADPPRLRRLCGWDSINAAITSLPVRLANAA